MEERSTTSRCSRCDDLVKEVESLRELVETLKRQLGRQQQVIDRLTKALEESRRAGKRQAAPFRKKPKPGERKKPGRKGGASYGRHARRCPPREEEIRERYHVPLPESCPHCRSSKIESRGLVDQYQVELPQEPIYRLFAIETGECVDCRRHVQGRHELQTSDATGAASVQLGPRAHAAMAWLNKRLGLSHGKIRSAFRELFGIDIARSTSARSCHRTAKRCLASLDQIENDARGSPQVVPDETGWRVGGEKAWLHAFVGLDAVRYVIDPTRSGEPVETLLGEDWSGYLVHDGWSVYNRFRHAIHQQCTAHLINRCKELLETAVGGAARFPQAVKDLLQRGLAVRDRRQQGAISEHGLRVMAGRLKAEVLCLVGVRKRNPGNERLAQFLFDHVDSLFAYLFHPGMDATNYRGEQSIRYAVVNRKVWGGNRTWAGAATQSTLMSVMQTCVLREISPVQFLVDALCASEPILLPAAGR